MKYKKIPVLSAILLIVFLLSGCGLLDTVIEELKPEEKTNSSEEAREKDSDSGSGSFFGYVEIPEDAFFIGEEHDSEEVRELLTEALANKEEKICIQNRIWLNTPDLYELPYGTFWVENFTATRYWGKRKGDEESSSFDIYEFRYFDLSMEEIQRMKEEIDEATAEIISHVTPNAKSWGKSRTVHDQLCRLITYDQEGENPHCYDLYGALVDHRAVCSGYACAFTHVMRELGMNCPLSYSDDHAWNRVSVPSNEIYIDITWDDTDTTDRYGEPYIDYSYFFLTREECESIDSHSIQGMDPYIDVSEGRSFNYYTHEGYYVEYYDEEVITEMFRTQYEKGKNLITVRFANQEDYETAKLWQENDGEGFDPFIQALEYYDAFYYWYNDNVRTVSIGLYA